MPEPADSVETRGSGRVTRATLATQVEEAIRADILGGVFEPGERLRAADLTARYGVSSTPLREALRKLAAQNLVELGPRLGATVAPISQGDLHDIYWLRSLLEAVALERSIANAGPEWEDEVRASFDSYVKVTSSRTKPTAKAIVTWQTAHRRFHDALFAANDSPWLSRFVAMLTDHSERYRMLSHRRAQLHSIDAHRVILDAALSRDATAAREALKNHLAATVAVLTE